VVGLGALGCPASELLANAGIARLTLLDADRVESSNLQRQILFDERDLGRRKVEAAAERLVRGHGTKVEPLPERLTADNARALFEQHDFVLDCCDDPDTKFLMNATALATRTAYCYAGVIRLQGQAMVILPHDSACLACVFGAGASQLGVGGCSAQGILAPVAGVVGSLQALLALHYLDTPAEALGGRMYLYSLEGRRWHAIRFPRLDSCDVCGDAPGAAEPRRLSSCHS